MLNNVKSNFSFNEMNKKDLPVVYFTVFRCLLVVLLLLFFCFGFVAYLFSVAVTPFNAWFPYDRRDRPDRPSRLKKCSDNRDDPDDHMENSLKMTRRPAERSRVTYGK